MQRWTKMKSHNTVKTTWHWRMVGQCTLPLGATDPYPSSPMLCVSTDPEYTKSGPFRLKSPQLLGRSLYICLWIMQQYHIALLCTQPLPSIAHNWAAVITHSFTALLEGPGGVKHSPWFWQVVNADELCSISSFLCSSSPVAGYLNSLLFRAKLAALTYLKGPSYSALWFMQRTLPYYCREDKHPIMTEKCNYHSCKTW